MSAGSASFTNRPATAGTVGSKRACGFDRVEHRQPLGRADLAVDLAERGREVHDARAVVDGDEVGRDHARSRRLGGRASRTAARSGARRGRRPRPGRRRRRRRRAPPSTRSAPSTRSRPPSGSRDAHVLDVGADRGADVADERPRRRRPHEQVEVGVDHREPHVDRVLGDVLVRAGLAELVARERGAAPAAVGHDLGALVDELLVPELVEEPPDALDVVVGHRPVGVGGVEPHADPAGQRRPVLDVAVHRLAAPLVERLDAEVLDLRLAREAELLLDLDLDRQPVAVPAGLAARRSCPASCGSAGRCP